MSRPVGLDLALLRTLQHRTTLGISDLADELDISSRSMVPRIKKLMEQGWLLNWRVVFHPLTFFKKHSFLWLKTNPRETGYVDIFHKYHYQRTFISLEGLAGEYSLVAHFQFKNDSEFLNILEALDRLFSEKHLPDRYRWQEIVSIHKWQGFSVPQLAQIEPLSPAQHELMHALMHVYTGLRPPNYSDIATYLKKSQSTVYRMLAQLQKKGFLLGYSIETAPVLRPVFKIFVQLKIHPRGLQSAIDIFLDNHAVAAIYRTAEEFNLQLEVYTASVSDFDQLLKEFYLIIPSILDSRSIIILNDEIPPNPYLFPL